MRCIIGSSFRAFQEAGIVGRGEEEGEQEEIEVRREGGAETMCTVFLGSTECLEYEDFAGTIRFLKFDL